MRRARDADSKGGLEDVYLPREVRPFLEEMLGRYPD